MRTRSLTRRRFLASAGAGGAALALRPAAGATAAPLDQGAQAISPQAVGELAEYAAIPLAPDRAAELAPLLAGALAQLRALRTDNYGDLEPAVVFRVPPEG
jgi:hypothetical protein